MKATDPISNMLVGLKNASMVGKLSTIVPASKMKLSIAELLQKQGYVAEIIKRGKKSKKFIELTLPTKDNEIRRIDFKRMSKPSRRVYKGFKEVLPVRQGSGIGVYSTPKGIITDKEMKKEKVGGEYLFMMW